jgi:hypothetical protein
MSSALRRTGPRKMSLDDVISQADLLQSLASLDSTQNEATACQKTASQRARKPQTSPSLRQRRLRALKYRELYLLPRFVREQGGSKRKLEAGEYDPNSELYPLSTSIQEMSDFGIGIGMYFTTTLWIGVLMACCGIFQLPIAIYYNTNSYDSKNDKDGGYKTGASASCMHENRVCLNVDCTEYAGEMHFPSATAPRYISEYNTRSQSWRIDDFQLFDDDQNKPSLHDFGFRIGSAKESIVASRDKLTVGVCSLNTSAEIKYIIHTHSPCTGLRSCALRSFFGFTDFCMMVFATLVLLVLGRKQDDQAEALDLAEQTAQDYSIVVNDPNPDITDPDRWKEWFEAHFGAVFMVSVCLNNCAMLKAFKLKRAYEHELRLDLGDNILKTLPTEMNGSDRNSLLSAFGMCELKKQVLACLVAFAMTVLIVCALLWF